MEKFVPLIVIVPNVVVTSSCVVLNPMIAEPSA